MQAALIAVQLEVSNDVLVSGEVYRRHLEQAATRAVAAAGPADARLIVFPELAGHLALLAIGPPAAHRAKTLGGALVASAIRRPLDVLRGVISTRVLHPRHAVLAALAPDGERFLRGVFGPLARRLDAYIVAGSHLRLAANGDLTNASLLFAPDGRCVATTDKVNLVPGMEDGAPKGLGLTRGDAPRLPIVETPMGRIATLICYDGFHTPHTSTERFTPMGAALTGRGGVTVVANPAANPWPWDEPWPPADIAPAPHRYPTRGEQWQREGLPGMLAKTPCARCGVTAHLVGRVLDLRFDGVSEIVETHAGGVRVLARAPRADRGGDVAVTVTC
ncbi:MAG: Hydrolase, carbon-nitrogen family [Deltaproteobacteria bacterium]|nr:Hydrolase, carbon-nitrogen family [Deltaproteobacteria bacterium]